MAQKTRVEIDVIDDLDNSLEGTQTRTFAVGGQQYEIDLCDENAARFDTEMKFWTDAGRKFTGKRKRKVAPKQAAQPAPEPAPEPEPEATAAPPEVATEALPTPVKGEEWWRDPALRGARLRIRHWGRTHGWPHLGDRGAVPAEVYDTWFDRVWAKLPEPSWEALEHAASAGSRNGKVVAAARRTKPPATRR